MPQFYNFENSAMGKQQLFSTRFQPFSNEVLDIVTPQKKTEDYFNKNCNRSDNNVLFIL